MLALVPLLSSVSLLLAGAAPARLEQAAAGDPVVALTITGRGWGHGVGMSQWGAYGFAQHGSTYAQILAHYYRGTELAKAGPSPMRVLLATGRRTVAISSTAPFDVKDGSGESYDLAAGSYSFGPALKLKVDPDKPAKELTGPLAFSAGAAPVALDGKRYRGSLEVSVQSGALRVINVVGLDAYLLGVVPSEVPHTWPVEALKAQAVAARSYALATRKPSGPFDAYADVRSQVYGGMDVERPTTTAAVQATGGQVVMYEGRVATTYFFSTSGGRTANVADVWGGKPVPYLVSVPDPYDSASPYHSWGPLPMGQARLKRALALPGLPVDARVTPTPSGRAAELVVTLAGGGEATVPAATVRTALGLRSTWFRLGVLALRPPDTKPVTFGTKTPLEGTVRGLSGVALERRPLGGVWQRFAPVAAGRGGSFAVPVKGQMTADYRLAAGKLRTAPVQLVVAPRLKIGLAAEPGILAGKVRPVFMAATVILQRLDGSRWVRAGRAVVDETGAFRSDLALPPGTYRARLAARAGFAAAVSSPIVLTP